MAGNTGYKTMLISGFGTDKVKGSANVLSKRTIVDRYPSVRTAFNSFPEVVLASSTYTANFATLSGIEAPTWNNLFSDTQYFRQTNASNYPALNASSPIKGNGPLEFVGADSFETISTLPVTSGRTYIALFEYKCTSNAIDNYILGEFDLPIASSRIGGFAFYADSTNLGVTMRNYFKWFKKIGSNYSKTTSFGPTFPRSVNYGDNVEIAVVTEFCDGSGDPDLPELNYEIRNEDLTSTTVTIERGVDGITPPEANWTATYGSGFPAIYLRLASTASEDQSYYAVLVYDTVLEDADVQKIIRILKTMYGL